MVLRGSVGILTKAVVDEGGKLQMPPDIGKGNTMAPTYYN